MTAAREGVARRCAVALLFSISVGGVGACHARTPCDGIACAAACPRDSAPDAAGRCACIPGDVLLLGACVPPAVGDSYCGPAAKVSFDGCVFRSCADNELLDAATGECVARAILPASGSLACGEGGTPVVAQGRFACVSADAACPRGTGGSGAVCPRPPRCPPGSLVAAGTSAGTSPKCRSVVTEGVHDSLPRVDLGAWSSLVLGPDGGLGTEELCRPLALRPDAFGVPPGSEGTVTVQLSVVAPDQDLTRVHVGVRAELTVRAAPRPLSAEAEAEIDASVATLVEPLRGLGGEASTGLVELKVRCKVRSL